MVFPNFMLLKSYDYTVNRKKYKQQTATSPLPKLSEPKGSHAYTVRWKIQHAMQGLVQTSVELKEGYNVYSQIRATTTNSKWNRKIKLCKGQHTRDMRDGARKWEWRTEQSHDRQPKQTTQAQFPSGAASDLVN